MKSSGIEPGFKSSAVQHMQLCGMCQLIKSKFIKKAQQFQTDEVYFPQADSLSFWVVLEVVELPRYGCLGKEIR